MGANDQSGVEDNDTKDGEFVGGGDASVVMTDPVGKFLTSARDVTRMIFVFA